MTDEHEARGATPANGPRGPSPSSDGNAGGADRPDPLVGAWLAGRYTILERIAEGGMGKLYRAVQSPMGRTCALKVLSPICEVKHKAEFHRRFFLEAATAARLVHPNTVTIYDYGNAGELYFIAMEYIEGVTLRGTLNSEGKLHPLRARHIVQQICRSLQEAHQIGIVHRDLKPENIMLLEGSVNREQIKVVDFGLAKAFRGDLAEELTGAGLAIGSPSYMSPEQILGEPISPATDIYALGVLLFELLTGDVPFHGHGRYQTLMAHVHDPPPTLASRLTDRTLHVAWQQILDRCLAKAPQDRFASMDDLLAALKAIPWERPQSIPPGFPVPTEPPPPPRSLPGRGGHTSQAPRRRDSRASIPPPHIAPRRASLPPIAPRLSVPPPKPHTGTRTLVAATFAASLVVALSLFFLWRLLHGRAPDPSQSSLASALSASQSASPAGAPSANAPSSGSAIAPGADSNVAPSPSRRAPPRDEAVERGFKKSPY